MRRARFNARFVRLAMSLAIAAVGLAAASPGTAAAATTPQLMPGGGQFFPVTPMTALDTRDGTGGVAVAPIGAHSTLTFPVTGIGDVPASDVSDVFVVISALSPTDTGALEAYNADIANPGIWTVPLTAGEDNSVSDMTQVSAGGYISIHNASAGTTDAVVRVMGYVQTSDSTTAGETYVPLPYSSVMDTRTGLGASEAQIPAGGSLTFQASGTTGVPTDAAGAAVYLGVADETASGWISAYPAGSTDPAVRVSQLYGRG